MNESYGPPRKFDGFDGLLLRTPLMEPKRGGHKGFRCPVLFVLEPLSFLSVVVGGVFGDWVVRPRLKKHSVFGWFLRGV